MQVLQSITKSFFVIFYVLANWQFNFNHLLFVTGREVMAAPLELLGQNNTLQNKIQAKFNVANQALADGLEQNQELLGNTQQTFSQANAAIRQSINPQQATSAQAQAIASPALCPNMLEASCPDLSPADTLSAKRTLRESERSGRGFSGAKPSGHIQAIAQNNRGVGSLLSGIADGQMTYDDYAAQVNQAEARQITPQERRIQLAITRKRLQVPSTLQDSTPHEAQKPVEQNLQPTDKILKIQQAKLVNKAKTQTLSNQSTGTSAWKWIKNGVGVASEYSADIKEQQQIQLELNSLRQNIADINVNGVEWLVQNSKDESVQQALKTEGLNIPSQDLTKEQAQQYTGALQQLVLSYEEQAILLEMRINTIAEKYTPYRLNKPQAQLKKTLPLKLKAAEQERQSLTQQTNQVNQNRQQRILGIQSPLNQNQEQPARTLDSSLTIDPPIANANTGRAKPPKVVSPFTRLFGEVGEKVKPEGVKENINPLTFNLSPLPNSCESDFCKSSAIGGKNVRLAERDYNEPNHTGHTHARVDVTADSGTPIQVGTVLGQIGSTEHSSGGHFDSKIPKANTFLAKDTVDPGEYLAGLNTTSSVDRKVVGHTNSWQYDQKTVKKQGSMSMAQNSLNTGSSLYILNDNLGNQNQSGYPDSTQQWFNFQVPAKKGYVPNIAYPEDNIDNTHGYAYLDKNVAFRRAINTTANKLGIPGSWIADVIAVETNFNPREFHKTNSSGYGGLIGFGTDDAQEFGTTLRRILSLPPERQMTYVEKYLSRPHIKRHLNRGVEYVAAAVFGGRGLLNKLIKNPSKALRTSDGAINLQTYMQRLGRDVGRRYDFNARLTKPTTFASSLDLQSRVRIVSINAAN